jgi:carbohydrate-binding DOMON domain-containing protein
MRNAVALALLSAVTLAFVIPFSPASSTPQVVVTVTVTQVQTVTLTEYVTQLTTETNPVPTLITRVYYVVFLIVVFIPWYSIKRKQR